ncbi:MAG: vitamin K epoxide reductase family protein, partial [Gemmatimonadota bacterium]
DWAVPFLLVGEEVLVGGFEIPARFPTIIQEGLAAGGIDLPRYPALVTFLQEREMLDPDYPDRLIARRTASPEGEQPPAPGDSVAAVEAMASEEPVPSEDTVVAADPVPAEDSVVSSPEDSIVAKPVDAAGGERDPGPLPVEPEARVDSAVLPVTGPPPSRTGDSTAANLGALGLVAAARDMESMTPWDRFNMDPTGNSISLFVLLGMVGSLVLRGYPPRVKGREWPSWVIPALVLVGAGVASYLSFIEVTQAEAVCGPVGDCNTVNQSEYAFLFGVLPVGILGLAGYGLILVLWVLGLSESGTTPRMATLGIWGAALLGTLFSVYLTFLEPFVIGATCAWCLTSAVVMTLLLWATAPMAARVWPTVAPTANSD